MSSNEYERVRKAVAIIDERDDSQDQRIGSLEATVSSLSQQVLQLEARIAILERGERKGH